MTDLEAIEEAEKQFRRLQVWLIAIMVTLLLSIFVQWQLRRQHQEIYDQMVTTIDLKNDAIKAELSALQMELGRYTEIQNENLAYVVTLHIKMAEAGIEVPEIEVPELSPE